MRCAYCPADATRHVNALWTPATCPTHHEETYAMWEEHKVLDRRDVDWKWRESVIDLGADFDVPKADDGWTVFA